VEKKIHLITFTSEETETQMDGKGPLQAEFQPAPAVLSNAWGWYLSSVINGVTTSKPLLKLTIQ
jgi:hypothetical protein